MSLTICEQIGIIAEQAQNEFQEAVMWMCLIALSIMFAVVAVGQIAKLGGKVANAVRFLGPAGCALVIPGILSLCIYASTKKPRVTWDTGLSDRGSTIDTNTWRTVNFLWNKSASIANTEPIYFAAKDSRFPELEWDEIGQSTAGQLAWSYTFPVGVNATNYLYYVFTIGEVHTNGVWLGNILQKAAPGVCGPGKMIFIRSRLELDGKQIAPFKEEQ